jgi:hypothetical protein
MRFNCPCTPFGARQGLHRRAHAPQVRGQHAREAPRDQEGHADRAGQGGDPGPQLRARLEPQAGAGEEEHAAERGDRDDRELDDLAAQLAALVTGLRHGPSLS